MSKIIKQTGHCLANLFGNSHYVFLVLSAVMYNSLNVTLKKRSNLLKMGFIYNMMLSFDF